MVFAWNDFIVHHPDSWAPVVISGNARKGYVRLSEADGASIQVRWEGGRRADHERILSQYLRLLERDARRRKVEFRSEMRADAVPPTYRYEGLMKGHGIVIDDTARKRTILAELTSEPGVRRPRSLQNLVEVVEVASETDWARWAMFGLDLSLPRAFRPVRRRLLAGRTVFEFRSRTAKLIAERWAFAEELIRSKGLASWASAVVGVPERAIEPIDSHRAVFTHRKWPLLPPLRGLVKVDSEANRINVLTLRSLTRLEPEWSWIN